VPGSIVQALGGDTVTDIPRSQLSHHSETIDGPAQGNSIFQSLSAKWMIKPIDHKLVTGMPQDDAKGNLSGDQTEVYLSLDFQFTNPLFTAMSKAVAPKVAGMMIEAFEARAKSLLAGSGANMSERGRLEKIHSVGNKANI
jgi:coenzyme Q-binding protein COQ10